MSVFDNSDKDNLYYEIRNFLEENTITELLNVVNYCIEEKEEQYLENR